MTLHTPTGPRCSTARKPRACALPHCTTQPADDAGEGATAPWCLLSPAPSFSKVHPKYAHWKPLEKLWNWTWRDHSGHWFQSPPIHGNPLNSIKSSTPKNIRIFFITKIWMKILLCLQHFHALPHVWEQLPASSCKTTSLLSSKTPPVMPAKNLDNVLATCVLRLLSIMFINIVLFLLLLSRQPVPSVASCDMCRLRVLHSSNWLFFFCACTAPCTTDAYPLKGSPRP